MAIAEGSAKYKSVVQLLYNSLRLCLVCTSMVLLLYS